ncbi:MAG: tetratricopeptide repeat protein [Acidobacteria bacterium]|nr:tetratricopeptide repeat protein [Acidobacteriota bacterium]
MNRGNNHRSLKKLDEAIANYTKAISIEPKSEQFYNQAVVHFELKDYQAAVNDNTEAIRLDPKSSRAFKNRSLSYRRLGKVSLAL